MSHSKVIATLESRRTGTSTPPRDITSHISRSGDSILFRARNEYDDHVVVAMNAAGSVSLHVERDGKLLHNIRVDAPAGRRDAGSPLPATTTPD